MIPVGSKLAPTRGVTSWNNRNKEGSIHFAGKMTRVSDPGHHGPLVSELAALVATLKCSLVVHSECSSQILAGLYLKNVA